MPAPEPLDPVSQFGLLLKEAAEREQAEAARRQRQRQEARAAQRAAHQHEEDLADAQRQLERAIEAVRVARETRRGREEADAVWRAAKARVIELETGAPPSWATPDAAPGSAAADLEAMPVDDDQPADG